MRREGEIKIEYPLGYWIEVTTNIINVSITRAELKYRNPYHELAKLILRFYNRENNNNKKNIKFSKEDINNDFGLQKVLVDEILESLENDGFISNSKNQENYIINHEQIINLNTDPHKIWIRNIDYYFSEFPRFFIPSYLISFAEIRKSDNLPLYNTNVDINSLSTPKIRESIQVPEEYIGISDTGHQDHFKLNTQVDITLIPQNNEGDFIGILNRKNIFNWPLKKRIIEDGHLDYSKIKDQLFSINLKKVIEQELPPKDKDFEYDLLFDKDVNSWIMKIINIDYINFQKLKRSLAKLNFKLQLNHKMQYLELKLSDLISIQDSLQNQKIKCYFQIKLEANIVFIFYTFFLEREITNRSINYEFRDKIFNEIFQEFITFYELGNSFKQPPKQKLKDYYWEHKKYEMAYFFMYSEDFYELKPQFIKNPKLELLLTHNKKKKERNQVKNTGND